MTKKEYVAMLIGLFTGIEPEYQVLIPKIKDSLDRVERGEIFVLYLGMFHFSGYLEELCVSLKDHGNVIGHDLKISFGADFDLNNQRWISFRETYLVRPERGKDHFETNERKNEPMEVFIKT